MIVMTIGKPNTGMTFTIERRKQRRPVQQATRSASVGNAPVTAPPVPGALSIRPHYSEGRDWFAVRALGVPVALYPQTARGYMQAAALVTP